MVGGRKALRRYYVSIFLFITTYQLFGALITHRVNARKRAKGERERKNDARN
jgi:hypothetical protein